MKLSQISQGKSKFFTINFFREGGSESQYAKNNNRKRRILVEQFLSPVGTELISDPNRKKGPKSFAELRAEAAFAELRAEADRQSEQVSNYTIQYNDSWNSIALAHNTTFQELAKLNGIPSEGLESTISSWKVIKVPSNQNSAKPSPAQDFFAKVGISSTEEKDGSV